MRPFVLALVVLLAAQPASGLPPPSALEIDRLLKQLGDDDYQQREAASKALESFGKRAAPALRKAKEGKDPEVRRRANRILAAADKAAVARFSVTRKGGQMSLVGPGVRARADDVMCDEVAGLVILKGNAEMFLDRGPTRVAGQMIEYSLKDASLKVFRPASDSP